MLKNDIQLDKFHFEIIIFNHLFPWAAMSPRQMYIDPVDCSPNKTIELIINKNKYC